MSSSTQIIDEGAVHSDSALAAYATLGEGLIGKNEGRCSYFLPGQTVLRPLDRKLDSYLTLHSVLKKM